MRTALLVAILGSCWALTAQATVYRWVDADGVVHFSDQPHAGATEIIVQEPQTYSSSKGGTPTSAASNSAAASGKPKSVSFRYTNCSIGQPAADSTIVDADSTAVSVSLEPALRPGDHVSVFYDGAAVAGSGGGATGYTINPLERGTHALSVTVTDPSGSIMCQSGPVNFYVHQPSVLAPQNPNNGGNRSLPNIH
jgi:hypothetical protein